MLAPTRTRPTKRIIKRTLKFKRKSERRSIPWREVLKDHIEKYTEAGILLRANRNKMGLSQQEFGDLIGVSQNHISEMENGRRAIGKAMAKRFAKVFKTDYRYFL